MTSAKSFKRVLAIDPTPRGFAYAVLEGPECLINWGLKETRDHTRAGWQRLFSLLLKRSEPSMLVVEELLGGSRPWQVRDLVADFVELARAEGLKVAVIERTQMKQVFADQGAKDREAMAKLLAEAFPELAHRLPPPRKPWTSQDRRIRIFSALALGLTYYAPKKRDDQ